MLLDEKEPAWFTQLLKDAGETVEDLEKVAANLGTPVEVIAARAERNILARQEQEARARRPAPILPAASTGTPAELKQKPPRRPSFRAPQSEAGHIADDEYGRMCREVRRDKRLTDRQRAIVLDVFGDIQNHTRKEWIDLGTREIGRRLNISRQTAWRELQVILELGILEQKPFDRAKFEKRKAWYNAPAYRYVPKAER